jgi:hypothetical protein
MSTEIKIRNAKILSLRGKKSFGLIAKELGISRHAVAGVCFRADWPEKLRKRSPNGKGGRNKAGTGHHGGGRYAQQTLCGVRA